MKYFVELGSRQVAVDVDGDRVTIDGAAYQATFEALPGTPLRLLIVNGRPRTLAVRPNSRGRWAIAANGEWRDVEVVDERTRYIRSLAAAAAKPLGAHVIKAPMPGLVVRVEVDTGQAVATGAGVLVLEAMKMENELRAAAGGRVRAVRVQAGQAVEKGQVLIEFD
jgi:biotin carboxyl carrier protein